MNKVITFFMLSRGKHDFTRMFDPVVRLIVFSTGYKLIRIKLSITILF